ncbi:MAG: hypothetical protein JNM07_07315 [Phycisphaerae bacterium]|nr:hypothetical protein [Phycisphaerae bacterium]
MLTERGPAPIRKDREDAPCAARSSPGRLAGRAAPITAITVVACPEINMYQLRCRITNARENVTSQPTAPIVRVADFNCDGHIDDSSYFDYLNALNMGSPSADLDRYGPLDDFDRFAFTNALNAGC